MLNTSHIIILAIIGMICSAGVGFIADMLSGIPKNEKAQSWLKRLLPMALGVIFTYFGFPPTFVAVTGSPLSDDPVTMFMVSTFLGLVAGSAAYAIRPQAHKILDRITDRL